jgi:hypothetical protein
MMEVRTVRFSVLVCISVFAMALTSPVAFATLEFTASSTSAMTGEAVETPTFTTAAGTIECEALKLLSGTSSLKSTKLIIKVQYEGCGAFGLAASISPVEYEMVINGEVLIAKTVTISAGFGTCSVTIPSQWIKSFTYGNVTSGGKEIIDVDPVVNDIESMGTGTCTYNELFASGKGTYNKSFSLELPGSGKNLKA